VPFCDQPEVMNLSNYTWHYSTPTKWNTVSCFKQTFRLWGRGYVFTIQ